MKMRRFSWTLAWLAALGLVAPLTPVWADQPSAHSMPSPPTPQATISDAVLSADGTLRGIVLDAQGLPMPREAVSVLRSGEVVAETTTDLLGQFRIFIPQGGVYQVAAAESVQTLRVWDAATAPPAARPAVLLVAGGPVARGQMPFRRVHASDGFLLTAIIVAAIAIPVAISNARNVQPSSS